jgi:gamma-glutamylcyclotransferase (GGCT)/AIG2-like uncharacterized protein YtfP
MRHDHLFVYGTLGAAAGHPMGDLLRHCAEFVGKGTITARLYKIDDPDEPGENAYPGALPSPNPSDKVYGEVYRVTDPDQLYPALDNFEACSDDWPEPQEFALRSVPVTLADGMSLRASSYLYTWDVADAERIPSGRYKDRAPDIR